MAERLDYLRASPEATKGLVEMARFERAGSLPVSLIELAKVRASQINGCAYCLALHAPRARRSGVTQNQLDTLEAWRESPVFSAKERAALEWTEALTQVSEGHVPDTVWDAVRPHFTDAELVELSIVVVDINSWNRLQIAFRRTPEFPAPPERTDGGPTVATETPARPP